MSADGHTACDEARAVVAVGGLLSPHAVGLVDAHGHVWIEPPARVSSENALVLDCYGGIRDELTAFRMAGGLAVVDCQPPGCGRSFERLVSLWRDTGTEIIAATGFHLQRYYPPDSWMWMADLDAAAAYMREELERGMRSGSGPSGPRAGFVKTAFGGSAEELEGGPLTAACEAASATGAAVMVHTERGAGVELLPDCFAKHGVGLDRVILAHVDKRPDHVLHRELIAAGFLLEYDTFLRPRYEPESGVWPLLEESISAGRSAGICCGLDLAGNGMWAFGSQTPGMLGLADVVVPGLRTRGVDEGTIQLLTGKNILARLARPLTGGLDEPSI
jgi:5-phospho-D-xylono-1,4-lactonase